MGAGGGGGGLAHAADRCRSPGRPPCPAGHLDPVVLMAGSPAVERAVRTVVEDGRRAVDAGAAGHVFNLGHGVLPGTTPA